MAENPRFDIGALLAQDEELAQLLADVLEGQHCQEAREAEWRSDLQAMQECWQNMNQQWAAACAHGFHTAQPLIQDCMDRLDNVHPQHKNDFMNDFVNNIELVYGPIEHICDLIINELACKEEFDDENLVGGNEPRGAIEVAPNQHHSDPPADCQCEPGPIRPTGRAV
ncbi:hypothetical protein RSAG8_13211, partial [Rhizoctonia solani AG-8 WAC10335]